MKAKFIQIAKAMTLILANGTVFTPKSKETKDKFIKRVQAEVELDLGELEIETLTTASFAKHSIEKLEKAKAKETGLLAELIEMAIAERSVDTFKADFDTAAEAEKVAAAEKKEADKQAKAEAAEQAKADKEAKAKAKAEAAANKPTLEDIIKAAAEAKANVNHTITFPAHGKHGADLVVTGTINGVWVDKRVPMALYRIFDEAGKMYNKTIFAPGLEIGDLVVDTKAAEKETAAKAKADAKAAKEAEKVAAAKAKEEEKTAKANAKIAAALEKSQAKDADAEAKANAAAANDVSASESQATLDQLKSEYEAEQTED